MNSAADSPSVGELLPHDTFFRKGAAHLFARTTNGALRLSPRSRC